VEPASATTRNLIFWPGSNEIGDFDQPPCRWLSNISAQEVCKDQYHRELEGGAVQGVTRMADPPAPIEREA
jgi:hypothetical protein